MLPKFDKSSLGWIIRYRNSINQANNRAQHIHPVVLGPQKLVLQSKHEVPSLP
jgi:hypothetical protein